MSSNSAVSVDGEFGLFSGVTGKLIKRATASGIAKMAAGVAQIATPGTDFELPLAFINSLNRAGNNVDLDGDNNAPGGACIYGTNAAGAKGWFGEPSAYAYSQTPSGATSRATTSVAAVMSGCYSVIVSQITPTRTGRVFVFYAGSAYTTGGLYYINLRYGNPLPGGGAAAGGTVIGSMATIGMTNWTPFAIGGIITGLPIGATCFFDLSHSVSVGTVTGTMTNYACASFEF